MALVAMAFPDPVVRLIATGFSPEKAALCATLVRIMMPFLPAISLAVVAMGALNAEEKYTAPGLASSMFNLVAIAGGIAVWVWGPSARVAVMTWAALTLVGGVAQLAIQVPPLFKMGFRPHLLPDLALRDRVVLRSLLVGSDPLFSVRRRQRRLSMSYRRPRLTRRPRPTAPDFDGAHRPCGSSRRRRLPFSAVVTCSPLT